VWLCALVAVLLIPSVAASQPLRSGQRFVAARIGANLVGNTYRVSQERPTAGAGVSAGLFLSPYWVTELEAWFRASSPECCAAREQLISLSAERLYASGGVQPYLAGGLALLRSQNGELPARTRLRLQVQVAAGLRLPVRRRMAVDLDLRGNGGGSTMIVRPTVAAVYFF
jgi:hypothetical protein